MANEKELNPSPKFPVGEKPKLSPNPNFSDGLENKTSDKANTQIVNESKPQPIKNLTVQQIIELIQKYAPGFDPSGIEAGELVSALGLNVDGALKKQALAGMFDGKYVRIMDAPESTTLTDEQIEIIKEGVFINGDFLSMKNPILLPLYSSSGITYGWYLGMDGSGNGSIGYYNVNYSTKVISIKNALISSSQLKLSLGNLLRLNGKIFPDYPSNTSIGQFICRKGTLEYYAPVAQDGITSGDVVALDSNLGKALIDHLDVVINGFMARYEYTSGNYVVYSSKSEADNGTKLQVNMIKYNTTTGELVFNSMTFTPNN